MTGFRLLLDNKEYSAESFRNCCTLHRFNQLLNMGASVNQVGLSIEYGYARSLARFATKLGPVAWKIATKKIEKSLPSGVKFGPGWVGENDVIPTKPLFIPSSKPPSSLPGEITPSSKDCQENKLARKPGGFSSLERNAPSAHTGQASHPNKSLLASSASSSLINSTNKGSGPISGSTEASIGLNVQPGISSGGSVRPRPPFQIHPGMNGFNGAYGFSIPAQMGKAMGAARPTGFNLQASQMLDAISRTTSNFSHPAMASNPTTSEDQKLAHPGGDAHVPVLVPVSLSVSASSATATVPRIGPHPQPSWRGLPSQQRQDSVPPDLNVIFQSPGSPNSCKVDPTQPDLALQL